MYFSCDLCAVHAEVGDMSGLMPIFKPEIRTMCDFLAPGPVCYVCSVVWAMYVCTYRWLVMTLGL